MKGFKKTYFAHRHEISLKKNHITKTGFVFLKCLYPMGFCFLWNEAAVSLRTALYILPKLAGKKKNSPFFIKANNHYPENPGHPALLLLLFLTHEQSDCFNIHAVPSNKCLLATCVDIFKTVTLKNTHQHPNIWICAWGLDTFCTSSYSHARCNLILHLCCCRDTSLHPPTGSYTAAQDQPVGISGSRNLNSLSHLRMFPLYRATLIDKDRADTKELHFKGNAWSHADDGKDGCMSLATGEPGCTNLSAEQVKPLPPTPAILLEIPFYLFFIMLQLCMPAQHEADLRSLKILALKLKIEANHSRSQISSLQVTGSLPRKVLLFPRLIIIFPLRWISSLTENSITNRAKPTYSPTKLLYFHREKKKEILKNTFATHFTESKIFLTCISLETKIFWLEIWLQSLRRRASSLTPFSPRESMQREYRKKNPVAFAQTLYFSFSPHFLRSHLLPIQTAGKGYPFSFPKQNAARYTSQGITVAMTVTWETGKPKEISL